MNQNLSLAAMNCKEEEKVNLNELVRIFSRDRCLIGKAVFVRFPASVTRYPIA